jgi:alpha-galactosidase
MPQKTSNWESSSRRDFLRTIGVGAALVTLPRFAFAQATTAGEPIVLDGKSGFARLSDGSIAASGVLRLELKQRDGVWQSRLVNTSSGAVAVREVVLFAGAHGFGRDTRLYGESYQMLSQTAGTLGKPVGLGYSELAHYKLKEADGAATLRSMMMLSPGAAPRHLLAFSSCRRYAGEFRFWPEKFEIVLSTEDRSLAAGEAWELEEFVHFTAGEREQLLERLGTQIERNHPRLKFPRIPTGWCSWYYYGKALKEADILANLDAIVKDGSKLEYIQIDDGYQPAHGDWLEPNPKFFPMGIKALCHKIKDLGFQPAIWVAPFIASPKSVLLRDHPDWFVKGADGKPLSADKVTFQGWNDAPWYMLDATIPDVQAHLEHVFRVMREEWGCTYFKLDANFWGAVPGSHYADAKATPIENYRRGMEAVIRGAGRDSFILGCNAPMWGSLGLVHGMRVSGDIKRTWNNFSKCARETFYRNWQHARLWINDPDCLLASPLARSGPAPVTPDEISFHEAAILASGGMMLDGDDFTKLTPKEQDVVHRCLPPTGVPARFAAEDFKEGIADLPDGRRLIFVFNWDSSPRKHTIALGSNRQLADFWTDQDLGTHSEYELPELPPHSARVIVAKKA